MLRYGRTRHTRGLQRRALDVQGVRGSLAFVIRRVEGDSLHVAFSIDEAAAARVREALARVTRRQAA